MFKKTSNILLNRHFKNCFTFNELIIVKSEATTDTDYRFCREESDWNSAVTHFKIVIYKYYFGFYIFVKQKKNIIILAKGGYQILLYDILDTTKMLF